MREIEELGVAPSNEQHDIPEDAPSVYSVVFLMRLFDMGIRFRDVGAAIEQQAGLIGRQDTGRWMDVLLEAEQRRRRSMGARIHKVGPEDGISLPVLTKAVAYTVLGLGLDMKHMLFDVQGILGFHTEGTDRDQFFTNMSERLYE